MYEFFLILSFLVLLVFNGIFSITFFYWLLLVLRTDYFWILLFYLIIELSYLFEYHSIASLSLSLFFFFGMLDNHIVHK